VSSLVSLKHPKPLKLLQKHPRTGWRQNQNKRNPENRSVQIRIVVDAVAVLLAFDIGIDQKQAFSIRYTTSIWLKPVLFLPERG
jgi:hypothetical protein